MLFGSDDLCESKEDFIKYISFLSVGVEMYSGGTWCNLVSNQRFVVVYLHHLKKTLIEGFIAGLVQFSPQPLFYSGIFPGFFQLLCKTSHAYKDKP